MTKSELFERLGAPLRNRVWSWGARSPSTGTVFLFVWKDEIQAAPDGSLRIPAADPRYSKPLGHRERLEHLEAVRKGAKVRCIVGVALDPEASPRTYRSFSDELAEGGELHDDPDGTVWLSVRGWLSLEEALREQAERTPKPAQATRRKN